MISAAHALLVLAANGPGSQPRPDLETTYHFEPLDDDRAVWRPSVDEAMLRQLEEMRAEEVHEARAKIAAGAKLSEEVALSNAAQIALKMQVTRNSGAIIPQLFRNSAQ